MPAAPEPGFASIDLVVSGGVAVVRFHSDGGPLEWDVTAHREAPLAFRAVREDPTVKAVVLTGTGDTWCTAIGGGGFEGVRRGDLWWEWTRALQYLLEIEVPVIGVLNGPGTIHAELPMIADIVLAADDASVADAVHFTAGTVPGDGVHLVWPYLLGPRRGKYFLLTGEVIGADELLRLGVVSEVHPRLTLHDRALELARELAGRPMELLRYTRELLNLVERDRLRVGLSHGLALENVLMLEK